MTEKDYSPLSNACVRALNDKLYDKRKAAALEIEKMIRDFSAAGNIVQIRKLLKILGQDFALSHNPNTRKGGLIGLAAMAIALGKESSQLIEEMIKPMLACFSDQDSRVRYYACEALYNVVKVGRHDVLPLFNEVFDALAKLSADPDQNVKSGAELLDRLMKDIVTESPTFDLEAFIPLLRERIYGRNQFSRQFIVSWIALLDSVPEIDMIVLLPEILDGLFKILADPTQEVRRMCENTLTEFLFKIIRNPAKADFSSMINILLMHSQPSSEYELVQYTALTWLKEFLNLANSAQLLPYSAGILTAILPCLSPSPASEDSDEKPSKSTPTSINIREVAKALNYSLMQLVTLEEQRRDEDMSPTMNGREAQSGSSADRNSSALNITRATTATGNASDANANASSNANSNSNHLSSVVDVLTRELKLGENACTQTKLAVLRWVHHLYSKVPQKMLPHLENDIFALLLRTLSDPSDEVVLLDLEVLSQIFTSPSVNDGNIELPHAPLTPVDTFFAKFMRALLDLFHTNVNVLEERGSFIIRQLCLLMNAEDIYRSLSEILLNYDDLRFAYNTVQTLNIILLTSSELYELRSQLKDLKTDESCSLFCCLYRTWSHSPVATVSLCLLTKNYKHACHLLMMFADLDLSVEFLAEIDQLVQLIESPIFAHLRLQLLDVENNCDLIRSLYGLLMLLPQSEAFHTLRKRLQCVPNFKLAFSSEDINRNSGNKNKSPTHSQPHMDFKDLLRHFHDVQHKHQQWRRIELTQRANANARR